MFITEKETVEAACCTAGERTIADLPEAILRLKDRLGSNIRLVATHGENGAYLMNGKAEPLFFAAQRVPRERLAGARDIFGTYSLLASILRCSGEKAPPIPPNAATAKAPRGGLPPPT